MPMKNSYDECLIDLSESDETSMFMNVVIQDDYDLLTIDGLLREAFSKGVRVD